MRKPGRPGEAANAPNRESRAGNDSEMSRLRRAEQALSAAEDFNRAILDAVSAQVAVLDEAGNIIAVNRPWRQFAIENSGSPGQPAPRTDVGTNYLEVCRAAQGEGAAAAMLEFGLQHEESSGRDRRHFPQVDIQRDTEFAQLPDRLGALAFGDGKQKPAYARQAADVQQLPALG